MITSLKLRPLPKVGRYESSRYDMFIMARVVSLQRLTEPQNCGMI